MEKFVINEKRLEQDKKFLETFQYRGKHVDVPEEILRQDLSGDQRHFKQILEHNLGH